MIIRPTEFGMIQQQNTVSQIRHGEDAKPMIEQQTIVDADNRQKKFDAKDKSDNEYQPGHKNDKNKKPDGKVIIKGQEYQNVDFDVRI